jgi:cation diffusion facilitator CzcD-associated flavoprotein CzcO
MTQQQPDYDVLIVGSGISGIGTAYHLKKDRPGTTFAILEGRDTIGGTWSLFRYPGIRSDSDMPTFGFGFKPWTHRQAIADAEHILDYLQETVDENGLGEHLRFGHRVVSADFSRETGLWTVKVSVNGSKRTRKLTSRFLFVGSGYYDYDTGYTPEFRGIEDFAGTVIHPQHWPEDFDHTGKRVVVIGSGATAVTLIPAMAKTAAHVTMLQRSPSYVISLPQEDPVSNALMKALGPERAHSIIRRKNILQARGIYKACMRSPKLMRRLLIAQVQRQLPKGFDVDTHFTPKYNPWEQRLCAVPNGDLFKTIKSGRASVVTDHIDHFTEHGIQLTSGQHLDADVIVTATGLNMLALGRIQFSVDGRAVNLPETVAFKAMMVSGLPNLAFIVGYTNLSHTLRVDLIAEHFVRLLDHMDAHGYTVFEPVLPEDPMELLPLYQLNAGYMHRGIAQFPRAGTRGSWTAAGAYEEDVERLRHGPVTDSALQFSTAKSPALVDA